MRIGVIALQGGFAEHIAMMQRLDASTAEVRLPIQLDSLDGLIIPGGESTTIGKLMMDYGLLSPLREFAKSRAIWGTCAGAILLARDAHRKQPLLELMDIAVHRNAFGSQVSSFEADIDIDSLKHVVDTSTPYRAIFIRAPVIESVGGNAKTLSTLPDGRIVAAQQGKLLATAFHPELTCDTRFHEYFLTLARGHAHH